VDWNTFNSKEPAISTSTANKFYSWDKTWRSLTIPYITALQDSLTNKYTKSQTNLLLNAKVNIADSNKTTAGNYTTRKFTTDTYEPKVGVGTTAQYYRGDKTWQTMPTLDGSETKVTAGTNVTVSGSGTTASPYVINATSSGGSSAHYIGEFYQGGIIFWVDNTGTHGLIASLIDVSTSSIWSNVSSLIGSTAQSSWDGLSNSNAIVAQSTHTTSAAKLCLDYSNANYGTGVYSDWYLPAIEEYVLMKQSRYILNKNLTGASKTILDLVDAYWTSTEYAADFGWYSDYQQLTFWQVKSALVRVRAVRAF
jgi:hypothetical protein